LIVGADTARMLADRFEHGVDDLLSGFALQLP
jgi:hypothetical protein